MKLTAIDSRHSGFTVISCCVRPTAGGPDACPVFPLSAAARRVAVHLEWALSVNQPVPGARMSAVQPSDELPREPAMDEPRGGPTVLRIMLGNQLRRLREAGGITPDEAGYEIRGSRSKISRIEHGRVGFKERDIEDLLTLYGVTDEQVRAGMLALARQANSPGWWAKYNDILPEWFEPYLGLEMAASLIRSFELQFVHGLFQTEDYARAVTILGYGPGAIDEIERRVSVRIRRQEVLTSADPPRVWFVIDEAALRRPRGTPGDAHSAQTPTGGGRPPPRHHPGCAVPPRGSRGRGRVLHDPAFRGAGPSRRRLPRAPHECPLPG